jgi:hypothetical protein
MRTLATALLLLCGHAFADTQSAVAIRNAKIVTVSGPAIAKGTVILRKGLIEAVGENVAIPADAWVVDGEGLTVYPGMIDALSTVGIASAAPAATAAGGRGGTGGRGAVAATPTAAATPAPAPSRGPQDRPQTTSWVVAADEISPTDRRIETIRGAGITTTATYPTRGIFAGQGSLINLVTGEKPTAMILVPSVGQYIAMGGGRGGGGGGGFPGSLMGVISYIRQIYLDAEHYQLVKDTYAKDPRGMQRPEYDRALEGVLESKRILLPANRLVEVDRMLRFSAELKQPTVIYGGREAYRPQAAELLKKAGAPLLLSLRWPEKGRDVNPEDEDSFRVLETRDKAASAPLVLKNAGVKFAFYSDGIEQPRDLQRAVKKAIDAGLSREDAVRALTLSPAEIYGVADRLGSIEKGKIANVIVTRGDLFDANTKIEMIFVDGKKYTPAVEVPGGAGRGAATDDPGVNR